MEVISGTGSSTSSLNPNAPMFVPLAYRTVEDFSDQWWALVQSSPWFRDYWLCERFQDPQNDPSYFFDFELDEDALFHHQDLQQVDPQDGGEGKELVSKGALKWRGSGGRAETPRYAEKAPKIVKCKVSPRMIQQPR